MKRAIMLCLLTASLAMPLAACQKAETDAKPAAISMTDEALGHYCQMYLADHGGPKAQIHLAGFEQPLWFSQVSDAIAYLHDPEREAEIRAIYVTDMAAAASWSEPGRDNWIDADTAFFVTGSRQLGGMGVPEAIPFASRAAAERFVAAEGGSIVALEEIPEAYVRPQQPSVSDGHGAGTVQEG